jgi:hypothetical protein
MQQIEVKTTMPTSKTHTLNIPFFRKKINGRIVEYRAVFPDATYVKIFQGPGFFQIVHQLAKEAPMDIIGPYELDDDWRICEEEDFLSFHMETLKSLSLEPQLTNTPAADPNDMRDINI